MTDFAPDTILVLLDVTPSGQLASSSAGLLGAAAQVGTPVALVVHENAELAADAAALGATAVLSVPTTPDTVGVQVADALAAAAALVQPDAVLVSHSLDGRDAAARFAARTRSALAVDAVGVSRDAEGVVAHHSVYGGAYNVDSAVTFGAPVITVRQGSIDARAEARTPEVEVLAVAASDRPDRKSVV